VLTRFINKAGPAASGDNLFVETPLPARRQDGVPGTDGMGDLQQGNLEQPTSKRSPRFPI